MLMLEGVGEKRQTERGLCLPVKYWIHDGSVTDKITENICTLCCWQEFACLFFYMINKWFNCLLYTHVHIYLHT